MALNEIHAILKRTRYGTGSQWSDLSNGAEGVRADERVPTRDNEFCMRCSLYKFTAGM